ncbi:glycosyltransferase [Bacteroides pyogenes]|uniref:glycosyltransferase n=1 Tax=Bacteroides pyogenes TaxID=310300 RepID=UPI001BA7EDE5|nr:glycosyltransferase [Bacteroides pyogenes]MBR8709114.1 hypothetical protein [Bacteroides pyogenes]MBR8717973.1 hypothetical protein [Bacteroides pyogenes]MBR8747412.1 hypothetical protein [Bacteroides pyogenes]MBR8757759.1 hypothetical protein [Bacteroides pyogenes]MBR8780981.1 hypothetical protein [Bacteroides pyogenes]
MKIVINTISTKKQAGGAFQIAQNFLLKSLDHEEIDWYYFTSQDVDNTVGEYFALLRNTKYFAFQTQPDFRGSYQTVKRKLKELEAQIKPDVVYSVTAPSYFTFNAPEVMRFTNPWVTHPNKYAWSVLPLKDKIRCFLYCLNQKRMMKAAHYFITQTETCAKGIRSVTGEPSEHVKVVNNVLPVIFKSIDNTPIVEDNNINIACVGAATIHKNFDIIPQLLYEMDGMGFKNIRIHVTIPFDNFMIKTIEGNLKKLNLVDRFVNHGRLSQKELGEMYRRCQFCFLPTLLEVFSASAVEAMYFQLPIVATDFNFNSEVLEDSCLYYEPKNAKAAAQQFAKLISDKRLQEELNVKMKKQLTIYGDYDTHFNAIKDFLVEVAERKI